MSPGVEAIIYKDRIFNQKQSAAVSQYAFLIIMTVNVFDDQIVGARIKTYTGPVATVNIDIGNFKAFNDNIGGIHNKRPFTHANTTSQMGAPAIGSLFADQV